MIIPDGVMFYSLHDGESLQPISFLLPHILTTLVRQAVRPVICSTKPKKRQNIKHQFNVVYKFLLPNDHKSATKLFCQLSKRMLSTEEMIFDFFGSPNKTNLENEKS